MNVLSVAMLMNPKGDSKHESPGTPLQNCRPFCPVCAKASQFQNIGPVGMASGFQENLSYGLGVKLTPTQKNLLIFGA